jgi:hypothetical protein
VIGGTQLLNARDALMQAFACQGRKLAFDRKQPTLGLRHVIELEPSTGQQIVAKRIIKPATENKEAING